METVPSTTYAQDILAYYKPLRWSHSVNTIPALLGAMQKSEMLEADVHYSIARQIPIFSHDPETSSVTSAPSIYEYFAYYISSNQFRDKPAGIKLDFKMMMAVAPTLQLLKEITNMNNVDKNPSEVPSRWEQAIALRELNPLFSFSFSIPNSPKRSLLWFNADIIRGPNGWASVFDPHQFIETCLSSFPTAIFSMGWTTGPHPNSSLSSSRMDDRANESIPETFYTHQMIDDMLAICAAHKLTEVTFAVRASYLKASIEQGSLQKLYDANPSYTLTVWTKREERKVEEEAFLKQILPADRTFFDLEV
jgi:hypothetical protein